MSYRNRNLKKENSPGISDEKIKKKDCEEQKDLKNKLINVIRENNVSIDNKSRISNNEKSSNILSSVGGARPKELSCYKDKQQKSFLDKSLNRQSLTIDISDMDSPNLSFNKNKNKNPSSFNNKLLGRKSNKENSRKKENNGSHILNMINNDLKCQSISFNSSKDFPDTFQNLINVQECLNKLKVNSNSIRKHLNSCGICNAADRIDKNALDDIPKKKKINKNTLNDLQIKKKNNIKSDSDSSSSELEFFSYNKKNECKSNSYSKLPKVEKAFVSNCKYNNNNNLSCESKLIFDSSIDFSTSFDDTFWTDCDIELKQINKQRVFKKNKIYLDMQDKNQVDLFNRKDFEFVNELEFVNSDERKRRGKTDFSTKTKNFNSFSCKKLFVRRRSTNEIENNLKNIDNKKNNFKNIDEKKNRNNCSMNICRRLDSYYNLLDTNNKNSEKKISRTNRYSSKSKSSSQESYNWNVWRKKESHPHSLSSSSFDDISTSKEIFSNGEEKKTMKESYEKNVYINLYQSSSSSEADDEFECECAICFIHQRETISRNRNTRNNTHHIRGNNLMDNWINSNDRLIRQHDNNLDSFIQELMDEMMRVELDLFSFESTPVVIGQDFHQLPTLTHLHIVDNFCAICLNGYEEDFNNKVLPCSHFFHTICIQTWLAKSGTCPICRDVVLKKGHI